MTGDSVVLLLVAVLAGPSVAAWMVWRLMVTRADTNAVRSLGGARVATLRDPRARLVGSTAGGGPRWWPMPGTLALGANRLVYSSPVPRYAIAVPRHRITEARVTRDFLGTYQPQALMQITWMDSEGQTHVAGWIVDDPGRWVVALRT